MSYISAGTGKSIVLIHGWSQSAEQFKYQISAFAERYHVVAVDLRGHGKSEKAGFEIPKVIIPSFKVDGGVNAAL